MVSSVDLTRHVETAPPAIAPERPVVVLAQKILLGAQAALNQARHSVAHLGGGWTNGTRSVKTRGTAGDVALGVRREDGVGIGAGRARAVAAVKIASVSSSGVPVFGRKFEAKEPATRAPVGGYRIIGNKTMGVEPGFIGKKTWTAGDASKAATPGTTAHTYATNLVDRWLDAYANSAAQDVIAGTPSRPALHADLQSVLRDIAASNGALSGEAKAILSQGDDASGPDVIALFRADTPRGPLALAVKSGLIAGAARASTTSAPSGAFVELGRLLKQDQLSVRAKFTTAHYVKLDYYESDKFLGRYQIPIERSKGTLIQRLMHRLITGATPRERNAGAVRESLANTLMSALGIESQKLKIVESQYADGTTKLMLDGTHVSGFKDFDGKPGNGDLYLKDGVLVRNAKLPGDADTMRTGAPVLHTELVDLGRNKILLLAMSDRDAIGSAGGNKGYVGNRFIGIDPGHALEPNLLNKRGDIRTDFSFKQPSLFAGLNYKNFSMFDQSSLAEKMEGVRQMQALKDSGRDMAIFTAYTAQFGESRGKDADFSDEINVMRSGYEGRRDDILGIFAERLGVDGFHFDKAVDVNGQAVPHKQARDTTLNLLDAFEKLTSKTTAKTQSGIALDYIQVTNPADRKEWHIAQDPTSSNVTFSFSGTPKEAAGMLQQVRAFVEPLGGGFRVTSKDGVLAVTIRPDRLSNLAMALNYTTVKHAKHGAA